MDKKWIIAGALVLLISGGIVASNISKQYQLLKQTCFSFVGYKPISINKNSFKIEVAFNVKNISSVPIELKGYDFDVFLNNTKVSRLQSIISQTIAPQSATVLYLLVDLNPSTIGNIDFLTGLLLNYQNAMFKIKGKLSAKTGGISVNRLPINIQSRLRDMMPKPDAKGTECMV